jgi:cellulose synthase/poly-beta-1,6-N-acetylglucosamine synthase-like glycosyltransferase
MISFEGDFGRVRSSFAFLVGLVITYWLHSQYQLDVSANPISKYPIPAQALPLITVIIPARNEQRNIRRCLRAIWEQTYPYLEVIVVEDRSTDGTAGILEEIEAAWNSQAGSPVRGFCKGRNYRPIGRENRMSVKELRWQGIGCASWMPYVASPG